MSLYWQYLNNIDIKDKKSDKTENKWVNGDKEDIVIHDKEITFLGSEKDQNDDDEEIFTDDIEVAKMGNHSSHISK